MAITSSSILTDRLCLVCDRLAHSNAGVSDTAPRLPPAFGVHALTVSPIAGPQGLLAPSSSRGDDHTLAHHHLTPEDASPRVPLLAPKLAGMRCYLSRDNLQAASAAAGASSQRLERWYERGQSDASRFLEAFAPPEA